MMNGKDAVEVRKALDRVLPGVVKPGRYVGGEWNMVRKDWERAEVRMAFLFPDVYEVGMSNLALRILYGLVNEDPRFLCERSFAPWPDMEEKMKEEGIPLYTLESFHPLDQFDVLGVTLQYELSYTNILGMLRLSGIPWWRSERGEGAPWLIAGGPCAYNPEPLAPFFDVFLLGEGEEQLPALLAVIAESKKVGRSRQETLESLVKLPGVYAPTFYDVEEDERGKIKEIRASHGAPAVVAKALVEDFEEAYFPEHCLVPYNEAIHDRVMLEVMRGCTRGCRFCQAGMIYRPLRERRPETLLQQAENAVKATGYEEISLVSLSTGDYSSINTLLPALMAKMACQGVNVSLPSLRLDSFDVKIAEEVQKVRKSGLTFAPEAGTERLRKVINKGVTEDDLLRTAEAAFRTGWSSIKLYYMIGLPTETYEDLEGIAAQAAKVLYIGKQVGCGNCRVTVSVSSFVPKPHTPFQWAAQDSRGELRQKQIYLQEKLRDKRIKFLYHDVETSFAEAILARGDRHIAFLLAKLTEKGCRFDGWSEWFRPDLWEEALRETGLDLRRYTGDFFAPGDILPWDHLSSGVQKDFLRNELQKALREEETEDCRQLCVHCGVCAGQV